MLFVFAGYAANIYSPSTIVENYGRLAITSFFFSIPLAVFLYIKGVTSDHPHFSGSFIYDFYMGLQRHPRIGSFDLKYFCEGRPGLTAWSCLSFVFLLAQHEKTGTVQPALVVCALLHALYVGDYFYYEDAVLSTLDITKGEEDKLRYVLFF